MDGSKQLPGPFVPGPSPNFPCQVPLTFHFAADGFGFGRRLVDVQNLLTTLLTSEEHRMVLDKAREEANVLHVDTPGKPGPGSGEKGTRE